MLADTTAEADALFTALSQTPGQLIFVYPNADAGSHALIERARQLAASRPATHIYVNLEAVTYFSLLGQASALIGNSSSGIMEAASFHLPAVNIGFRQQGRERAPNVLDAPADAASILAAIHRALAPEFRASLANLENPFGDGTAAQTIARVLASAPLARLLAKPPVPA
jgi:UDP-N-acetylglucosamine 2-epimerase (non-hydrolysing)/GDP/UDP-N,N'-diacetylbacillosamine 2-epimerase (hydrolysing)